VPVSDAELEAAVGGTITRRPWERSSTAPLELVWVDGLGPYVLKTAVRGQRPAFVVDPAREREAYELLPPELDAPRMHAAGPGWLLLERVDGVPLSEASGLEAWEQAARWLARLHSTAAPPASWLLRRDEAHLLRWVRRAVAFTPALAEAEPALRAAAARLARAPAVLLHGEAYPANLLVEHGVRIRPVDWEMVGTGSPALDVAALTSGDWEPDERAVVVTAYREAFGGGPAAAELDAARLLIAAQWLGWSNTWTPPAEHRHDWLAEVEARSR
jgi:Ser/Thr protein kinase RdoA (MazF antagonist)